MVEVFQELLDGKRLPSGVIGSQSIYQLIAVVFTCLHSNAYATMCAYYVEMYGGVHTHVINVCTIHVRSYSEFRISKFAGLIRVLSESV